MKELYDTIFKRKSMRKFDDTLSLTEEDLKKIKCQAEKIVPLDAGIKVKIELVNKSETTVKRGEYCFLFYSEKKSGYLLNAGYMLEQMDLFLASRDIGVCWYGLAKPKKSSLCGLDYVIMIAFGKSCSKDFRKSISEFRRKAIEEIWDGDFDSEVKKAVRLAPSACNTQPWRVKSKDKEIKVFRDTKIKSFIPKSMLAYYNPIDMGIFLCYMEIVLLSKNYRFERVLADEGNKGDDLIEIAVYNII
ncbi:MAG: nitroreductase family protein [Lachnospiraceae bacterium]|nr:nitroreductase family protein [Lachnospiraceae bacterium]